jgi:hypothetical protein
MPGRRELKELELRRRELVLQSSVNRLVIDMELRNVQCALRPAERIVHSVRAARPWLMLLAPLAGILAASSLRNNGSGFSKVMGLVKWIQPLLALWKQFGFSANGAGREPSSATAPQGHGARV